MIERQLAQRSARNRDAGDGFQRKVVSDHSGPRHGLEVDVRALNDATRPVHHIRTMQ